MKRRLCWFEVADYPGRQNMPRDVLPGHRSCPPGRTHTSRDFLIWQCYGQRGIAPGTSLHGSDKQQLWKQRQEQMAYEYCARQSAKALADAHFHRGPKHMRSDVDRVVFGVDMDASEAAVIEDVKKGEVSSWNQQRLERGEDASVKAHTGSWDKQQLLRRPYQPAQLRARGERPASASPNAGSQLSQQDKDSNPAMIKPSAPAARATGSARPRPASAQARTSSSLPAQARDASRFQTRQQSTPQLEQGPQTAEAWSTASQRYIEVRPLVMQHFSQTGPAVTTTQELWQRRVGAARPTAVNPRPQSANPRLLMSTQRANPAFLQELEKWTYARDRAHANTKRPPSSVLRQGMRYAHTPTPSSLVIS